MPKEFSRSSRVAEQVQRVLAALEPPATLESHGRRRYRYPWRAIVEFSRETGLRKGELGRLLKEAGVDMTTDEPLDLTVKAMNRVMDEMEQILAKKNASPKH